VASKHESRVAARNCRDANVLADRTIQNLLDALREIAGPALKISHGSGCGAPARACAFQLT
jgi:hypothetical protein